MAEQFSCGTINILLLKKIIIIMYNNMFSEPGGSAVEQVHQREQDILEVVLQIKSHN